MYETLSIPLTELLNGGIERYSAGTIPGSERVVSVSGKIKKMRHVQLCVMLIAVPIRESPDVDAEALDII